MLDEAELRLMSPEQRVRLARTLAALDRPRPVSDPRARRRRKIALAVVIACCVFLVAWICVLAVTLPSRYRTGGWRGAWVGFDIVELFGFASVAWAAWRGKQLLIVALIVTSTLLCCDAWFDLTLDWGTHGFGFSVFSAICGELPLAVLMIIGARRLLRLTVATAMAGQGIPGPVPPLWRVPLISTGSLGEAERQAAAASEHRASQGRASQGRASQGRVSKHRTAGESGGQPPPGSTA